MQEDNKHVRFAELLELHINNVIKRDFSAKEPTPTMLKEMHVEIRRQVDNVFTMGRNRLTPEARSWLTDQFFKAVKLNSGQLVSDLIVTNEHKLALMPLSDIGLLHGLFDRSYFHDQLKEEYQRRSQPS